MELLYATDRRQIAARIDAEIGSDQLRRSIQDSFRAFERRHRLTPGEAQTLLLDTGVKL